MQDITKQVLYNYCQDYLKVRLEAVQDRLKDIQDSLASETKSSVGDKYETGRAMLHLEKEKQMTQLSTLIASKKILSNVCPTTKFETVQSGALVTTSKGCFYIAITAGKMVLKEKVVFVITLSSPIGNILFNKKKGDSFNFRGKTYTILEIV